MNSYFTSLMYKGEICLEWPLFEKNEFLKENK
jgi:hypothetical protein